MMSRLNLFLTVVLVMVLALLMLVRVNHSLPNYQIILGDDMTYSPAYGAYAPNKNFADGRTLQNPVAGTLARGEQRFEFESTPEDAIVAGEQLTNPFRSKKSESAAAADRGAVVFQAFCTSCHGSEGAGNGPVAMRGFPPPPSLLTGKSRDMQDGQLFHIFTYGQNSMPTFAAQLPPDRRWDVINYIRRLQQDAPPPATQEGSAGVSAAEQVNASVSEPGSSIQAKPSKADGTTEESEP